MTIVGAKGVNIGSPGISLFAEIVTLEVLDEISLDAKLGTVNGVEVFKAQHSCSLGHWFKSLYEEVNCLLLF